MRRDTVLTAAAIAAALVLLGSGAVTRQDTAVVETPRGQITAAVADTPGERRTGLMNREELPRDGMLFVYGREDSRVFWMKNTSIPLDIVFIAGNGTVLNVEHADPEPHTPDENLTRYHSEGPARYVLEIRQGRAVDLGLSPGATVEVRGATHLRKLL